jgi:hypothetical protein
MALENGCMGKGQKPLDTVAATDAAAAAAAAASVSGAEL